MNNDKLVRIIECKENNLTELQKLSQKTFYDRFMNIIALKIWKNI